MTVDPYLDPVSGVLRNRLGILDPQRLREAEAGLTLAALADLGTRTLPGAYDLAHLQAFHREIFGDLYPWAGELRVVGIARSDPFCLPQHIETYSAEVFDGLAKERHLRGLTREVFLDRVTHYFAEVNVIHPFRERERPHTAGILRSAQQGSRVAHRLVTPSSRPQRDCIDGFPARAQRGAAPSPRGPAAAVTLP